MPKVPLSPETVVCTWLVFWLVSVIVAPGSTAPDESRTDPLTRPRVVWPAAAGANASASAKGRATPRRFHASYNFVIGPPPSRRSGLGSEMGQKARSATPIRVE